MNYEETRSKLKEYLLARIPFISINTVEKNRVINMMKEINSSENSSMFIYSMSKGMYDVTTNNIVSTEKTLMGTLTFISSDIQSRRNATYLLTDVSDLESDNITSRFLFDIINSCEEKSCSIIVISENSIWTNIKRLGMNINLDFPNEKEILTLLHKYIDGYSGQITLEWNENNFKEASIILLGLSETEIKNTIAVLISKKSITINDLTELKFAKDKLFSNMNGLEKISTTDIVYGGLDNLKKWLESKKKLYDVENKEKLAKKGIKPPRGILVVGVPGCGKSLTAKAISKIWNMPLYLLDFAMVLSMYVGQSEEQLKKALETAEHVSPCILWIDEIEKGLAGMKDSSGVTSKMVGQFLFWLQECKKEVFVVATANDVEDLPSELLRKGRFDEIFFVDLPTSKERKELLMLYSSKYLSVKMNDELLNELVEKTKGYASSDIEAGLRDIAYSLIADNITLTKQYMINYFENGTNISQINPEKIAKTRGWGRNRAINASIEEQE